MVATAKRVADEGYPVMPHFPARIIKDQATLTDWIARYQGEAGVDQALLLAGGVDKPHGDFHSSMQLLESGAFGKAGLSVCTSQATLRATKILIPMVLPSMWMMPCVGNRPFLKHQTLKWR